GALAVTVPERPDSRRRLAQGRDPRFFFFQAEDGIRDATVTGVQTCALPSMEETHASRRFRKVRGMGQLEAIARAVAVDHIDLGRSEERRVGKECRSRGGAHEYEKG